MKREWGMHLGLVLLRLIGLLPYGVVRHIGAAVGELAYWLAARRRRITQINLAHCFPHWSAERRTAVARGHFRAFIRSFFERFIFWHAGPERIRRLCRIEGLENFDVHRGKPVILLAPHFVGLDAGGIRFSLESDCAAIYGRQKSRALSDAMTRGRVRFGDARMLLRTDGMRPAIKVLREPLPLMVLPDMDLGARDAVFVPFFGVPAATVTSISRLAHITGAAVVPFVTEMTDAGYVVRIYPAWEGFGNEDPEIAARRMNEFIEQRVLEMPEQYLWSHKRFKTRPPGEPGFY